jgi:large subunit ribosomal protein L21
MYAIVDIAGQQFKVEKDQKVYVHRLDAEEGKKVNFDRVLLIDDNGKVNIGAPAINGAQVSATVLEHLKGDKVIVFKKKRRKGYQKKNGHRQYLTEIQIDSIVASGAKKAAAPKKEETPKAEAKEAPKEEAKPAEAPKSSESTDLSAMTVAQLKEMAKSKEIAGYSSMKKAELIEALS